MTEPTTAAGPLDLDKAIADMRKVLPTVVAEIEQRARQQDGSALRAALGKIKSIETSLVEAQAIADELVRRDVERAALAALPPSAPPALNVLNVLTLAMAIDSHALAWGRDEPVHDDGTCSTDCAGDIAARYASEEQDR